MFLEAEDALFRKLLNNKTHFFTHAYRTGQKLPHNKSLIYM